MHGLKEGKPGAAAPSPARAAIGEIDRSNIQGDDTARLSAIATLMDLALHGPMPDREIAARYLAERLNCAVVHDTEEKPPSQVLH